MSLGGSTGAGGGSIVGTAPPLPSAHKQPDGADLVKYMRSGPPKTDSGNRDKPKNDLPASNDAGVDVPTDEQSQKLQDFDAVRGRPNFDQRQNGDVQVAQASAGTMSDASPEMIGNGPGADSSQIRLERSGQAEGGALQTMGNVVKKGVTKAGGVVTGIAVPTNSSHDQTLTIPGHPQYRIVGKESEGTQTLERENADGTWSRIGDVSVMSDQNGQTTVDMADVNDILNERGLEPIVQQAATVNKNEETTAASDLSDIKDGERVTVPVGSLEPLHDAETSGKRPELESLSDEELLDTVETPKNGDYVKVNPENGKVVDGNGRVRELQERAKDANNSITSDTDITVEGYVPDNSAFDWDD